MNAMTIRSDFQPQVDEFIGELEEFATGSYLQDGETEFWEAPFDAAALPELKAILERTLDAFEMLPDDPPGDDLAKVVTGSLTQLRDFNERHQDAVLEDEEMDELRTVLLDAAAATGATDEALTELPDIEL